MLRKDNLGKILIPDNDTEKIKWAGGCLGEISPIHNNDKLMFDLRAISPTSFSCEEIKDGLYKASRCTCIPQQSKNSSQLCVILEVHCNIATFLQQRVPDKESFKILNFLAAKH